jgi:SAM-dependent methyltransferase
MLQVMTRKASQSRNRGSVLPIRANLAELDCLADRSADHAICLFSTLGMIQGRANRRNLLRRAARIVKPGGSLLMHVHNRWAALREHGGIQSLFRSRWRSCRHREHEFGDATYPYRGLENMFMHRFSRRELMDDLNACGWETRKIWPVSIDGSRIDPQATIPGGFIVFLHHAYLVLQRNDSKLRFSVFRLLSGDWWGQTVDLCLCPHVLRGEPWTLKRFGNSSRS